MLRAASMAAWRITVLQLSLIHIYRERHESDFIIADAATRYFRAHGVSKLPSHKALQAEICLLYTARCVEETAIIQGNPGEGKTYFAMRLAAACTNRKPLPGMETLEPFNIIYQTAEDGLGDTVKPRLMEADADLEKVLVIDDRDTPLTLADERIARAIRENNARLVIIDPVQAFLGTDVDMNRANEVRPIFRSLGAVSYTHLDVYKRQRPMSALIRKEPCCRRSALSWNGRNTVSSDST